MIAGLLQYEVSGDMLNTLSYLLFPSTSSVSMVISMNNPFIFVCRVVCNQEKKMDIKSLSRIKPGIGFVLLSTRM